jgi:hypothetical protein
MDLPSQIESAGYTIVSRVYEPDECRQIASDLLDALTVCADGSTALRRANGSIYGARNLLDVFPPATEVWRRSRLIAVLQDVLGPSFGLVRGLYFDKPPASNWSLPWHRDLTIAVRDHSLPSQQFRNPTKKGGVQHVEAPDELLRQMLTLRIHLDDVNDENGPLQVIPGTHHSRDAEAIQQPVAVHAQAGDVLAMRPLLMHSSGASRDGTDRHRRVIHLEFAACESLPDGFQWHWFIPGPPI